MARDSDKQGEVGNISPAPAESIEENQDSRSAQLGDSLRHIYDDILSEPIPDNIEDLLRKLG